MSPISLTVGARHLDRVVLNAEELLCRYRTDTVKDQGLICKALDWIAYDLNRPENDDEWDALHAIEPARTRIQLFDNVWWMYFRLIQPVVK